MGTHFHRIASRFIPLALILGSQIGCALTSKAWEEASAKPSYSALAGQILNPQGQRTALVVRYDSGSIFGSTEYYVRLPLTPDGNPAAPFAIHPLPRQPYSVDPDQEKAIVDHVARLTLARNTADLCLPGEQFLLREAAPAIHLNETALYTLHLMDDSRLSPICFTPIPDLERRADPTRDSTYHSSLRFAVIPRRIDRPALDALGTTTGTVFITPALMVADAVVFTACLPMWIAWVCGCARP